MKKITNIKNNSNANDVNNSNNELKSLIILIIVVSLIFIVFYGITFLLNRNKNIESDYHVQAETIQYSEILIGQMLNQKEKEYYVLIKNGHNNYNLAYTTYLDSSQEKYYTVDLNNNLNVNYVDDKTNINEKNFFNSKFADTTLVKVKNKKISKTYTTHEEILTLLKKLAA